MNSFLSPRFVSIPFITQTLRCLRTSFQLQLFLLSGRPRHIAHRSRPLIRIHVLSSKKTRQHFRCHFSTTQVANMSVAEVTQMKTAVIECRELRRAFLRARSNQQSNGQGKTRALPFSLKQAKEDWERCSPLQASLLDSELEILRLAVSVTILLNLACKHSHI